MLRSREGRYVDPLVALADPAPARTLADLRLPWPPQATSACAALRYRREVPDAPALVGLIGGASSGKSTLFNALLGREASRISAQAHETRGPVAAVPAGRLDEVNSWLERGLLPGGPQALLVPEGGSTIGELDRLCIVRHSRPDLSKVLLFDLPDVTSRMAADEGDLTASWLPWFDALLVVVDEERWFDAKVFAETVEPARQFGPRVWIVFNSTAPGEELTSAQRERLAREAEQRGVDAHVISPYQPGVGYRPLAESALQQVRTWLSGLTPDQRTASLAEYVQRRAQDVVHLNGARQEQFNALRRGGEEVLNAAPSGPTLALDLLDDEDRRMLAWPSRWLPVVAAAQGLWRKVRGGRTSRSLERSPAEIAATLARNFSERFAGLAARLDDVAARSPYRAQGEGPITLAWSIPEFDAASWAARVQPAIVAFRQEANKQRVTGDAAAVLVTGALVVTDLLATGGLHSIGSVLLTTTGFFGTKPLWQGLQGAPAFEAYQQEVRDYQQFLLHHVRSQWEKHLRELPRRHLDADDPLLAALRAAATPGGLGR